MPCHRRLLEGLHPVGLACLHRRGPSLLVPTPHSLLLLRNSSLEPTRRLKVGAGLHCPAASHCKCAPASMPFQTSHPPVLAPLPWQDIWGAGARAAADAPQLLGDKHAIAVMLGETVRAAAAAAAGADAVALRLSKRSRLTFSVSKRGSVTFSRHKVLALAKDAAACKRFNAFVAAALEAWQQHGKEGSQAERLGLLAPLQAAS